MRALRLGDLSTTIVIYLSKYSRSWQKEKSDKAVNNKQKYYFYVNLAPHFSQKKENQKLSAISTQVCPLGPNK